ncbi:MAG: VOC family protein [Chloroflexota bacterium]|nr:VOC family protein [Lentimicrobium sp.]
MVKVHPYVNFKGNCEEAFNFYKSILGGEFSYVGRYKDIPGDQKPDAKDENKIMHIGLPLAEGTILMGSDIPEIYEDRFVVGTNITLSLSPESESEARRIFDALSEGGMVTMPQDKTFWGSLFGMLTDKYGINWMVDYELPKE